MIYFKMEKIGNSTYNKEKKTRSENLVFITIPAAGVEPARPCGHWILSLVATHNLLGSIVISA